MKIQLTNTNLFQRQSIEKLKAVGIDAKPLANWIACRDHSGNMHTLMSEQGVGALVAQARNTARNKPMPLDNIKLTVALMHNADGTGTHALRDLYPELIDVWNELDDLRESDANSVSRAEYDDLENQLDDSDTRADQLLMERDGILRDCEGVYGRVTTLMTLDAAKPIQNELEALLRLIPTDV